MKRLLLVLPVLLVASCGAITEPFSLNFPSRQALSDVQTASLFVVPVANGDACPLLLQEAERGTVSGAALSESTEVGAFERGEVRLVEVPEGLMAYVAAAQASDGEVLLTGCVVRDVYEDSRPVNIELVPTPEYQRRIRGAL